MRESYDYYVILAHYVYSKVGELVCPMVLDKLRQRFKECGLELHPGKTKIVYCKDENRKRIFPVNSFTFLGYRKRYGSPKRTGSIKNRRFIDERPPIVDTKKRIGDWEIDTIIGKRQRQAVVSIVERFSKKTLLRKVDNRTADSVAKATISSLKSYMKLVWSITADNGSEFAYHKKISDELKTDFFFAHPYSSWERGLNENTNGLVRQYLKKGSSFSGITDLDLELITNYLNNRPRKSLGYATPNEIFNTAIENDFESTN